MQSRMNIYSFNVHMKSEIFVSCVPSLLRCVLLTGGSYSLSDDDDDVDRTYLSLGIFKQQNNKQNGKESELKRAGNETDFIAKKIKEDEVKEIDLHQRCIETDNHNKCDVLEMDTSKEELLKVQCGNMIDKTYEVRCGMNPSPQKKSMLQLGSSSPLNLTMCEESAERSLSEEYMQCPFKSLTIPPVSSTFSSQTSQPFTVTNSIDSVNPLQTQPTVNSEATATMTAPAASCLGKRPYSSSPFTEPKTFVPPGQLEVTLKHVCTTRYTRFTSRPTPLLPLPSVNPETSSLNVSNTSILPPAPKKKTRTSYSSGK